ncbi:MAG: diguanylate cyclase [Gammaproteobacteria bacterium]|nr:diguanylate cyclase [Gammaproteobacteria bacterium]
MAALQRSLTDAHRLRFAPVLEQRFRLLQAREFAEGCWGIVLPVCVIVLLFAAFDFYYFDAEVLRFSLIVRLGVQIPVLICAALLLRSARYPALATPVVVTAVLVLGCGSILVDVLAVAEGHMPPTHVGLMLVTFGTYLLVGLRLTVAAATALTLALVWLMTGVAGGVSMSQMLEGSVFLVAANALAALACYRLELARRIAFLRERMHAFTGEHDRLTGLYTQAAGEDRLLALLKLGRRERRPLGVALIAIDALRELDAKRGEDAVDQASVAVAEQVERLARRPLDFAAALGAGRYLLVLADVGRDELERVLELARQQIAALDLPHGASPVANYVTATSRGVWIDQHWPQSVDSLLRSVEAGLRRSRELGFNRSDVEPWQGEPAQGKAKVLRLFGSGQGEG